MDLTSESDLVTEKQKKDVRTNCELVIREREMDEREYLKEEKGKKKTMTEKRRRERKRGIGRMCWCIERG